jgi:hypothetical protein
MISKNTLSGCGFILLLIGICLLSSVLLFFGPEIEEEYIVFRRKQDFSSVESEFNTIFDDLPRSETDTVLAIRPILPLSIGRGSYTGCIKGSKEVVYGTTREFENVLDEYEIMFADRPLWVRERRSDMGYATEKAHFGLYLAEPSSSTYPPECVDFPVCYYVHLIYADPSLDECFE